MRATSTPVRPGNPMSVRSRSSATSASTLEYTQRYMQAIERIGMKVPEFDRIFIVTGNPTVSHVALRPGLRIHADSWSLKAVNPELAGYVQLGPVEIRGLLGYYRQWAVSFYRSECSVAMGGFPGAPCYSDYGAEWGTRTDPTSGAASPDYVYTSDVKLGDYATYTWDLQIKWRLSFLAGSGIVGDRLSRSAVELSGGMWFADRAVGNQFGIPLSSGDPSAPAGCSLTCGAGFAALGWYIPL